MLCAAHCTVDVYSSALGALQPLIVEQFRLSLSQAGVLGGCLILASYLTQPVFGWLADRFPSRHYAIFGPLIAGVGITSLGLAPNFIGLVALIAAAGLGMAMFHPQATSSVAEPGSPRSGEAMGYFIASGALGFSIGPTAMAWLAEAVTLPGLWIAVAPGALIALLLFWFYQPTRRRGATAHHASPPLTAAVRKAMVLLFLLVCIRSVIQVTYGHLLPLYFTREMGYSAVQANVIVSLYFAAGAIGGLFGGRMADRFGGRRVIEWSMLLSCPLLLVSFLTTGWLSLVSLIAGGFALLLTIPVNVMMAQNLAPEQRSTVSAFMMGFAWGITGILFVPGTAWLADRYSLHAALMGLTAFPLLGLLLARGLPAHRSPTSWTPAPIGPVDSSRLQ